MVSEGCMRCHSNNTPRRRTNHKGQAWICQNTNACRRRQRRMYRNRRRVYALSPALGGGL